MKNMGNMNKDCLLKLGWKLHSGEKSLWCQVMREKYDTCNNIFA